MSSLPPPLSPTRRGGFVTPLAKISLLLAVAAVLYSLAQLAVAVVLPVDGITGFFEETGLLMPASMRWLLDHLPVLSLAGLAMSVVFLISAWGLLKRREWGRLLFIAFLVVTALGNFAGVLLVAQMFDAMQSIFPDSLAGTPEMVQFEQQMLVNRSIALASSIVTALAFAVLHAWVIHKLCTPAVRAEFR